MVGVLLFEIMADGKRVLSAEYFLPAARESRFDTRCSVISLAGQIALGMDRRMDFNDSPAVMSPI